MDPHPKLVSTVLALLVAVLSPAATVLACEPAPVELRAGSFEQFRELDAARNRIDLERVDYALLAEAIFHETNRMRRRQGFEELVHSAALDRAACTHAEAMVEEGFFAHLNPHDPTVAQPVDRVRQQGLQVGYLAENIGQVFPLHYESGTTVYVREVQGTAVFSLEPGGEPLELRSYLALAEALVSSWLGSEGHRANILSPEPRLLGAGCELDDSGEHAETPSFDMPILTCVQLFFKPL